MPGEAMTNKAAFVKQSNIRPLVPNRLVACTNGAKHQGISGRSSPSGDAFDVDYVAHHVSYVRGRGKK
jgi:hypothetical protein